MSIKLHKLFKKLVSDVHSEQFQTGTSETKKCTSETRKMKPIFWFTTTQKQHCPNCCINTLVYYKHPWVKCRCIVTHHRNLKVKLVCTKIPLSLNTSETMVFLYYFPLSANAEQLLCLRTNSQDGLTYKSPYRYPPPSKLLVIHEMELSEMYVRNGGIALYHYT